MLCQDYSGNDNDNHSAQSNNESEDRGTTRNDQHNEYLQKFYKIQLYSSVKLTTDSKRL
jgi:hypothetical protein